MEVTRQAAEAANAALREGLVALGLWRSYQQLVEQRMCYMFLEQVMREASPAALRAGVIAV